MWKIVTVKELINELEKCNPDDLVLYDHSNEIKNRNCGVSHEFVEAGCIDDLVIGNGTTKRYLNEVGVFNFKRM